MWMQIGVLLLVSYTLMNYGNMFLLLSVMLFPLVGALQLWFLPVSSHHLHRIVALFWTCLTFILSLWLWATFDSSSTELFQRVTRVESYSNATPFIYIENSLKHIDFYNGLHDMRWSRNLYSFIENMDSNERYFFIYILTMWQNEWKGLFSLGLEFGIDGRSLWMILLTTALFPLCVLCSWQTMWRCSQEFFVGLLVLETMLLAVWCILDLLSFYILYESVLIPMFLRIGLGGSRQRKIRAAYQLVLYTLFGSLFMRPCLLFIYSETGTTNVELLYYYNWSFDQQLIRWWGFFFAFAVKIPMMPFHLWLPEAHVEASTAGSVLLAGVLLKLGAYGFLRFMIPFFPEASAFYSPWMITLSLIALIYTSLTTLRQVDLKKIIAYSSIAHMNMVILAIFSFNDLGGVAAFFMMISHGVVSPALFLLVGILYDRYHTKLLKYLGGTATSMPLFSIFFFIFSLANMALPLFPNFISEFLIFCGIYSYHTMATLIASISMVLSAAYSLWAYARVTHGLPKYYSLGYMCDICRIEFWTLLPLLVITIWLGIKPTEVLNNLATPILYWQNLCYNPNVFPITALYEPCLFPQEQSLALL